MRCLEQTKAWLIEHEAAGRGFDASVCRLRIKWLERCQEKSNKPQFIAKLQYSAENAIIDFNHRAKRGANYEHYLDDVLEAVIKQKAIQDFRNEIYEVM